MNDIISFHISKLVDIIQPNEFVELGAYNIDRTLKILDILKKVYEKNKLTYIIATTDYYYISEFKFKIPQINNVEFKFIELNNYINSFNKDDYFIKETEFIFVNYINDYSKLNLNKEKLKNIKCVLFDRYLSDYEHSTFANKHKKFCNDFLKGLDFKITPNSYTLFEDNYIFTVHLCISGIVSDYIDLDNKNKNAEQLMNPVNALDKETIHSNIRENIIYSRNNNISEIFPCEIHESTALMVAAGESYKKEENFNIIQKANKENNEYVFASKTTHDYLINNGVIPYGCILLDPREHVIECIKNPNKEIIYFVASQCNPEVIKYLNSSRCKIYLYHVAVQYEEEKILKEMNSNSPLIIGGSTSMVRGISLLNTLGFYKFKLFGYDSSYVSKPLIVHGYNKRKLPIEVGIGYSSNENNFVVENKKFWTDPEMIVQCNDLEFIMKNYLNLKIENYSDGLFKEIYDILQKNRLQFNQLIK